MRICLLSKEYPPDTGWGGIGAYNYQIAHGLKEIGHDVEVISLAARHTPGKSDKPRTGLVVTEEIPVHRVPWRGHMEEYWGLLTTTPISHFMIKTNMALWSKLQELHRLQPFDVVEVPEHLAEGLLPSVIKSLPVVIKIHTPYSKFIAERFHNTTPAFDHQFIALLERIAMLSADALISPSMDMARYVCQEINCPLEYIRIIKNPVDAHKFTPDGPAALEADGRLTVLFVGRLEERKGIRYLINAVPQIVQEFPNVRFVIIGSDTKTGEGHTFVLPQLQEALASSGHSKDVTFIPHVPLSEMPAYYRSADICIAPSLYDNAPYTCLEAMSTGKAFIGTDAGGMPEYVINGETGLIIPAADNSAIANATIRLLKNDQQRLSLGQKARQYVLTRIHRTEIARENEEVYHLARMRFQQKKDAGICLQNDSKFVPDAMSLLRSYEDMLYSLLYVRSPGFRFRHRLSLLASHPKLLATRFLNQLSARLLGRSSHLAPFMSELREQISSKRAGHVKKHESLKTLT